MVDRKWVRVVGWLRMKPIPMGRGVEEGVGEEGRPSRRVRAMESSVRRAGSCGEVGRKLKGPGIIPILFLACY
jgi:hypothetical protein